MKYDSGMTHFKKDIIAAIKKLLTGDKEITEKFKAEDGSPAPLREYLKKQYGKLYQGCYGKDVKYTSRPAGIVLEFDTILNNPGDKELTLSWSQVAKFIRDNWDEIFMDKPTYREALKQQLPQLTDGMINRCTSCPGYFFDGDSVPSEFICDYGGDESLCLACWDKPCEGTYNGEPFVASDWSGWDEPSEDQQTTPDEPEENSKALPEAAEEISAVFDYSVLDNDTAQKLEIIAAEMLTLKKEFIFKMAEKVKAAHDLLANHGNGLFGSWCESVGISRQKGNSLLQIVKIFDNLSENELANVSKLKPSIIYEISKPSAPPELVEQVMNGDITTHKEYIALKKQLEEEKYRANHLKEKLDEKSKKIGELNDKNISLEKQVKDLREQPVDVAVQDVDEEEIHRRAAEYAQGIIRSKELEFEERLTKIQKENRQLKKEISEAGHTELDDCFDNCNSSNEEMLSDIYETLHGKVLSALGDCAYFIHKDGLPESVKSKAVSRFESISETLENYIDELEEN